MASLSIRRVAWGSSSRLISPTAQFEGPSTSVKLTLRTEKRMRWQHF